jgi:D-alanyl-D-alanine carboxypeptidase
MIKDGVLAFNPQMEWTGGGVSATAKDLARWAKLLYEGKAFDSSLLPAMLNGIATDMGPDVKYGLGVILRPSSLGPTYGHSGFFPGYRTQMLYFPEHRLAVAIQMNTSVPEALPKPYFEMAVEVAKAALGK